MRPTWIEIDLGNIRHNTSQIKNLLSSHTKILGVVKADAYGHGAVKAARAILKGGADVLGVATLAEAIQLREDGGIKAPILLLGPLFKGDITDVFAYDITPTIFTMDMAKRLSEAALKYKKTKKVHIKVDTGMWRFGVYHKEAVEFIKKVLSLPEIKIEGIFSHLATAYLPDKTYAWEQFAKFYKVINELKQARINPLSHISNSAAIFDLPEMNLDLVRPGIALYGLFPSKTTKRRCELKPAMSFKTKIVHLELVPKGSGVSYGRTYITKKDTKVAVLPVGYADGYSRLLSNKGEVLVRGLRAPVIGTVCMDYTLIDVTHIENVEVGDEVVLFGSQGNEKIDVESVASLCQTISYEIITRIGSRVNRVYKGEKD